MTIKPLDMKMCNCAGCDKEIFGDSHREWAEKMMKPHVAGRIDGRPYCYRCLCVKNRKIEKARPPSSRTVGEDDPWQQNAVRDMEGE